MNLLCSLCIYVRHDEQNEALTVINGQAVCEDHIGCATGGEFATALRVARNEEGS